MLMPGVALLVKNRAQIASYGCCKAERRQNAAPFGRRYAADLYCSLHLRVHFCMQRDKENYEPLFQKD